MRFEGTESLKRMGITKDNFDAIKPENYELIYVGNLSELQEQTEGEMLEAIYEKFNIDHPEDYRGHSLSVSDIVVLHQNGKNSAHFVDSFGFTGLSDFMQTLEGVKEQEAEIDTSGQDVQKSEPEKQELCFISCIVIHLDSSLHYTSTGVNCVRIQNEYGVQYMIKRRWKIREKMNISIKSSKSLLHISRCIVTK